MPSVIDFFSSVPDKSGPQLKELRLGTDPVMVLAFTSDADDASLHWINDAAVKTYVVCPGSHCPVCFLGSAPTKTLLLPLLELEDREIKVLRLSTRRQPGSLGAVLIPHLMTNEIANKVLIIKRDGNKYAVAARPLQPLADRGEDLIRDFLAAKAGGLRLETAFRAMTAAELADVPTIATKLSAIGGWSEPEDVSPEEA